MFFWCRSLFSAGQTLGDDFHSVYQGLLKSPEGMWLLLRAPPSLAATTTLHSESPCGYQVRRRELLR